MHLKCLWVAFGFMCFRNVRSGNRRVLWKAGSIRMECFEFQFCVCVSTMKLFPVRGASFLIAIFYRGGTSHFKVRLTAQCVLPVALWYWCPVSSFTPALRSTKRSNSDANKEAKMLIWLLASSSAVLKGPFSCLQLDCLIKHTSPERENSF